MRKVKTGKFFVFEGIDGSGKATQANLLANFFISRGHKVEKVDFPRHGEPSCAMVDNYLNGRYGVLSEVDPYAASVFYACDRYDASFQIKEWLSEGKIVIADRYVVSNLGHQGAKMVRDKKGWKKYAKWLYNLEYGIFGIPKPDHTFILKTSSEFSRQLSNKVSEKSKKARREVYLGESGKQDIHEKDKSHLSNALKSYLTAAKEFPKDFKVIECLEKGEMLPPEKINGKIIKIVEKIIQ